MPQNALISCTKMTQPVQLGSLWYKYTHMFGVHTHMHAHTTEITSEGERERERGGCVTFTISAAPPADAFDRRERFGGPVEVGPTRRPRTEVRGVGGEAKSTTPH
jgi:hypothetical protein